MPPQTEQIRGFSCTGVEATSRVVDAVVCGEPDVAAVEEGLAPLSDLEGFDSGFDDFLLLVIVAIYGISNFQVDDSYFTTIGVDKGIRS